MDKNFDLYKSILTLSLISKGKLKPFSKSQIEIVEPKRVAERLYSAKVLVTS